MNEGEGEQLSFDDVQPELPELRGLERLGDSAGFGYAVLEILSARGWSDITVTSPFAGDTPGTGNADEHDPNRAVLVIARKYRDDGLSPDEVRREGPSVAAIAPDLLREALDLDRIYGRAA